MPKKKEPTGADVALSAAETVADVAMNGDLFAAVPIIGLAFKTAKAWDDVRDKLFARKLMSLLEAINDLDSPQQMAMLDDLMKPAEQRKVGEALAFTLEQITDSKKATIIGKLYRRVLEKKLDATQLRRLLRAVNHVFYDDLIDFAFSDSTHQSYAQELAHVGLVELELEPSNQVQTWKGGAPAPEVRYRATDLGRLFRDVDVCDRSDYNEPEPSFWETQ